MSHDRHRALDAGQDPPLVSVGLPVWNGERYLEEALDSLVSQTYRNLEIVISDNASQDATEDICRAYSRTDPRIRYTRNPVNIGGSRNHNRVFRESKGKYFMWAGHDDRRAPEYVARCVAELEAHPGAVICYTATRFIDEAGNTHPKICEVRLPLPWDGAPERFRQLLNEHHRVEPLLGLIRSEILRRTALERPYADSDRTLLAELGLHGPFFYINEPLLERRRHPGASIEAYPSRYARIRWSVPDHSGKFVFPHWRKLWESFRAVNRGRVPLKDRLRCYRHVMAWGVGRREALRADLVRGAQDVARVILRPWLARRTE